MSVFPRSIKAKRELGLFEIHWDNDTSFQLPFKYVRGECPCAGCINEFTGERILDLDSIPETIVPEQMQASGNYAIKLTWSDGHSTGLYTWDHLLSICHRLG